MAYCYICMIRVPYSHSTKLFICNPVVEAEITGIPVGYSVVNFRNCNVHHIAGSLLGTEYIGIAVLTPAVFRRSSLIESIFSGCQQVIGVDRLDVLCDLLVPVPHISGVSAAVTAFVHDLPCKDSRRILVRSAGY